MPHPLPRCQEEERELRSLSLSKLKIDAPRHAPRGPTAGSANGNGTPSSHISLAGAWSHDPSTPHGSALTTTYPRDHLARDAGYHRQAGGAASGAAAGALQDYKAKARALRAREFELERSLRALSKYSATANLP